MDREEFAEIIGDAIADLDSAIHDLKRMQDIAWNGETFANPADESEELFAKAEIASLQYRLQQALRHVRDGSELTDDLEHYVNDYAEATDEAVQ